MKILNLKRRVVSIITEKSVTNKCDNSKKNFVYC